MRQRDPYSEKLTGAYRKMHTELGCEGCMWADMKYLFTDPCCTFYGMIKTDDAGKCIVKVNKAKED